MYIACESFRVRKSLIVVSTVMYRFTAGQLITIMSPLKLAIIGYNAWRAQICIMHWLGLYKICEGWGGLCTLHCTCTCTVHVHYCTRLPTVTAFSESCDWLEEINSYSWNFVTVYRRAPPHTHTHTFVSPKVDEKFSWNVDPQSIDPTTWSCCSRAVVRWLPVHVCARRLFCVG